MHDDILRGDKRQQRWYEGEWRPVEDNQYGVDQLSGGDTLLIRAGTYNEAGKCAVFGQQGNSGAHATIRRTPARRFVIDGEYAIPTGRHCTSTAQSD